LAAIYTTNIRESTIYADFTLTAGLQLLGDSERRTEG
jgi:hypothetical protein